MRPSKLLASGPSSLLPEDLLVTPRNGRTIDSTMPRTGRALLRIASPFVVAACSAACLLKAADPASGVTPAADPPAVLPPPIAGRSAISPAAPILPGETVAALQDGNHEAARGSLVKLRENAKDRDERAYLGYLQGVTERLAGHNDAARATLRAAAAENPTGRWLPKIRFELSAIELAAGNLPVAEELARSEAIRLLSDDRKDRLAEVYHAFARRLLEPDDPVIQPDPKAAWDLLSQARDLAKSPVLRAAPLRDRPHQPDGGVLPQGDRPFPGLPQGVSRRSRPPGRSISPWRVPAPIRSASPGPADLGRSRTRHRAAKASRSRQGRAEHPSKCPRRDSVDVRHSQSTRRHEHEPGRCRPSAFSLGLPRASAGGEGCLRDRRHLSGPWQERPGACGPVSLPQGRWLQGRDRPGAP